MDSGREDEGERSFAWANQFASRARLALTLGVILLDVALRSRGSLALPTLPLIMAGIFETAVNQPYPFLRRLFGSDRRLYLWNISFDVVAFTVAAYAVGGLGNRFIFFLFLFTIALVGATAGRFFAYWVAALSSLASVELAVLAQHGLVPVLWGGVRRALEFDGGLVVSVHVFCFFLLAFFVSIPSARLREVIRRRREAERALQASKDELVYSAFYDGLTGVPNRALFLDKLSTALVQSRQAGQNLAVLFLDMDRFKHVNDTLGHAAGDALLIAVTERLQSGLRAEDIVGRFGGDEFLILIEDVRQAEDIKALADEIVAALKCPFDVEGSEVVTGASIGIALATKQTSSLGPSDILRHADIALQHAKGSGRSCSILFDATMHRSVVDRVSLEGDLRHAVSRNELRLFYQPLMLAGSGRLAGAEALVRWQHPERGLLLPNDFIHLAEETGLILPIGQWVLAEACRQMREWTARDDAYAPDLRISVNLSAREFQQSNMVERIIRMLAETHLDPRHLELEITESTMMQDVDSAIRALRALRNLGISLAIDDFGTGYSSLSYVSQFAVDTLKVDQSFVQGLGTDRAAFAIVDAVTTLAHALGSHVTAEGIETVEQLETVRALDCDIGQGNLFSEPVPADQFSRFLLPARYRGMTLATNGGTGDLGGPDQTPEQAPDGRHAGESPILHLPQHTVIQHGVSATA